MAGEDLYAALGLAPDATSQEIRAAYQHLIAQSEANQLPAAQRQAIESAHETLGDPIRRLRYDAQAAAPPPPRFQMPSFDLPRRRIRFSLPRPALRRPLPHIDPLLGILVLLLAVVAGLVLLSPLFRGSKKTNKGQPTTVADIASTPIPISSSAPLTAIPRATGAAPGFVPTVPSIPGLPGVTPPAGGQIPGLGNTPGGSEPPFLTLRLFQDALRAVAAANAVRNGPSRPTVPTTALGGAPGAVGVTGSGPPPVQPAISPVTTAGVPGIAITNPPAGLPSAGVPSVGAPGAPAAGAPGATRPAAPLPPELGATTSPPLQPQPGVAAVVRSTEGGGAGSAPASTSAPAGPNRIGLPSGPIPSGAAPTGTGAQPGISTGPTSGSAPAPNRFSAPTPTPAR